MTYRVKGKSERLLYQLSKLPMLMLIDNEISIKSNDNFTCLLFPFSFLSDVL